ncbi:helix-turn-helix domain-containing protein [Halalkalibacter oceani]|uniref:helix-turn-helix domain-containing protein n=1 Tax=Halalkalibacter oceani TaxID=1653776 RepID=UPI003397DA4A
MKEIKISLRDETYEELVKVVNYYNYKNELLKIGEEPVLIENFIKGSVVKQLAEIHTLFNYDVVNQNEIEQGVIKNRFKELLVNSEAKQKDLAEITKIDPSTLNLILNNKSQMSLDNFLRIWTAFNNPPIRRVLYRE